MTAEDAPDAPRAYDAIADRYDRLEADNRILAYGRARSLATLRAHLPERGRLLELGCGTGTEAVALARERDVEVVAFEPASGLAKRARAKAKEAGVPVEVRQATVRQALDQLGKDDTLAGGEGFDGGWASFALAYDGPLEALRPGLARALRPGAPFVCSLPNPWCLPAPWRIPARVFDRQRHKVGAARVPIRAVTPAAAEAAMDPAFVLDHVEAMNVLVPPARLGPVWEALGPVADVLEVLDARIADRWPWRRLGDHSLMVFRRRDGTGGPGDVAAVTGR